MNGERMLRLSVNGSAILLLLALSGRTGARGPVPKPRFSPRDLSVAPSSSTDAVGKALQDLDCPLYCGGHINESIGGDRTKCYLAYDHCKLCEDTIDFLIRTKEPVERDLLKLARFGEKLRTRYRATHILAQRGEVAVVPILDRMCASTDDKERYLAWTAYREAIQEGKLPAPTDFAYHLRLYAKEEDREVRNWIEWFLGCCRAKAAVRPLLKTIRKNPDASFAVFALGDIGDRSAVPQLLESFAKTSWKGGYFQALGKLPSPEAVDFLIKHLDEYGAIEALGTTGDARGLPALREHLEKLNRQEKEKESLSIAAARVAILRLSHKDPREVLLALAENRKEGARVRWDAFDALREYDIMRYHQRILRVYKSDPDRDIKRICIWILENSKLQGVTEAMMAHALAYDEKDDPTRSTAFFLLGALNKRMETSIRTMTAMQTYLRSLRTKGTGTK